MTTQSVELTTHWDNDRDDRDRVDSDPQETDEWLESLEAVLLHLGPERARYLVARLIDRAHAGQVPIPGVVRTPYLNTVAPERQPPYPGDEELEERIERLLRWNAAVMVTRANKKNDGIGGHISTYASIATIFEVALNHFIRGKGDGPRDQVFFQGHSSPGLYARAWLEGRLTDDQLHHFREEVGGEGLSSYPHPWLMPDFWEYPTVSMGLTSMFAVYQARFNRYLAARGLADSSEARVWAFLGDGEMDEPESVGALAIAAREGLSNLTFVVNCNLQRLDGPVRGNFKVIQELEGIFRGAGWNVVKCLWSRSWDELIASDGDAALLARLERTVDGDWQRYTVADGSEVREHLFDSDGLAERVAHLSDEEVKALAVSGRGGHDRAKVYAALKAAVDHQAGPTVVLVKSVKGYGIDSFAGINATHQQKKMPVEALKALRDQLQLPIADSELDDPPFYKPADDSPELVYLRERREQLGGPMPHRKVEAEPLKVPSLKDLKRFTGGSGKREASTTAAFAQLVAQLLKDEHIGQRVVPIIPDEARTFGMEALFSSHGIYSPVGQTYQPPDAGTLMSYKERADGQVLEEGICEAGAISSFAASGTSYAAFGEPTIPFYIFYSMFGFQRTGDQIWAFGDMRGRGFLLGATAGRTTLNGEGLQHEDGHSHLLASTVPNVRPYDPAFAYEVAVVIQHGLRRMYADQEDVFYYLTLYNENYLQPPMPKGVEQGIIDGLYRYRQAEDGDGPRVQLLGSGTILQEALEAQRWLAENADITGGVRADVWSATSYTQLRREALEVERWNRLNPTETPRVPKVTQLLEGSEGPIIAVSDYMCAVPDQIARWTPGGLHSLGTDGYGRSDTREALRRHFEVDWASIAFAALSLLSRRGDIKPKVVAKALEALGIDPDKRNPARA